MTRLVTILVLAGFLVAGCDSKNRARPVQKTHSTEVTPPSQLSVEQLGEMLDARAPIAVIDANNHATRAKYGVIPGATLLVDYEAYPLGQLPTDKSTKLVFYCAGTRCRAAGTGAERAILAGYTDVNVLPEGIMGWTEAGKRVNKI